MINFERKYVNITKRLLLAPILLLMPNENERLLPISSILLVASFANAIFSFTLSHWSKDFLKIERLFLTVGFAYITYKSATIVYFYLRSRIFFKALQIGDRKISDEISTPTWAEFIMMLFAKKTARNDIIGDMHQTFTHDISQFGLKRARRLYWAQTLHTISPLIWQRLSKAAITAFALEGFKKWIGL